MSTFEFEFQEVTGERAVPTLRWVPEVGDDLLTYEDILEARDAMVADMNVQPQRLDLSAYNGSHIMGMEVVS